MCLGVILTIPASWPVIVTTAGLWASMGALSVWCKVRGVDELPIVLKLIIIVIGLASVFLTVTLWGARWVVLAVITVQIVAICVVHCRRLRPAGASI